MLDLLPPPDGLQLVLVLFSQVVVRVLAVFCVWCGCACEDDDDDDGDTFSLVSLLKQYAVLCVRKLDG